MALAYTAPTWENGGGVGISASQLQALSDCMEGLVQGSDKAITNIAISGQTITLTFADGSEETGTASGLKGISSIAKTGTSGNVDTYTITYTDGSTSTFTVTNGADGSFYIVTAGIKSTDDPYGNIEYYIGGDFYKNGVLYNQSAFYKVTLVDETEYPPSPYLIDGSSGTFTNGHYSTGSIGGIPSGATITTQIFTDSTMATLLGEVKVLIGLRGSEGEQGPQGLAGDDGVSPEVTITTITGGHRVTITDATHPQGQEFDVMDGAGSGDMQASVYDSNGDVANAGGIAGYVSDKADKVSNATNGNFAGLDSNGNPTDSGKSASDFMASDGVEANPQGTVTGTLMSIGINGDKYEIQGGGSSSLAGLSDVNISSPSEGDVLQYDSANSKWVNGTAPSYINLRLDLYSAASDTLTFTDESGNKTVTTDADGHGIALITILMDGKNITFTSSVAKNPSNLSQAYSKTINVTENTTDIYVMPEHAIYWYGYKSDDMVIFNSTNGFSFTVNGTTYAIEVPSINTNYLGTKASNANTASGISTKNSIQGTKLHGIANGIIKSGSAWQLVGATAKAIVDNYPDTAADNILFQNWYTLNMSHQEVNISSYSAFYPFIGTLNERQADVYAFWYE